MPITALTPYRDERGNEIVFDGSTEAKVRVRFRGAHNRLVVAAGANLADLDVAFNGDGGSVEIGPTTARQVPLRFGR